MKKLFLTFLLATTACAAQQSTIDVTKYHNDDLVTCKNTLDRSELDYLKSQRKDVKSTIFEDYTISQIIDVNGKHWSVNEAEWTHFVCNTQHLN